MPTYIRLAKLTPDGIKRVRELPALLAEAKQIMEANGGKMVAGYALLGPYDIIAVVEAPDNATMTKISALIGEKGSFAAETYPAMTVNDFVKTLGG